MKFALIDGIKSEAIKGAKGNCPICNSELIAKCGEVKVHHWAHKRIRNCDSWWENETEWHRTWKNKFPEDWQEIALVDEKSGEKHIADIKTIHGLVIEFQHSHINPQERTSREKFYKNMVWVVDGTRLQKDYPRFLEGFNSFRRIQRGIYVVYFPKEVFPKGWLNSSVPVVFDFKGLSTTDQDEIKNILWCLLPQNELAQAEVVGLNRKGFVEITHNQAQLFNTEKEREQQRPQIILPQRRYYQRRGPLIDYIEKRRFSKPNKPRGGRRK